MAATGSNNQLISIIEGIRQDIAAYHDDSSAENKALRADLTRILDDHEGRLRTNEKILSQMVHTQDTLTDHEGRLRAVESDTAEIKANQKTATGILAALQVGIGAIAAWLGMRQ